MNYEESLEYLLNLDVFGWHPGLERIEQLMAALGNPEREMKFVHIGGTNGKGSTTAMTVSVLQEAGYKTGMFISPHLYDYRERIHIGQQWIPEEDLARITTVIRERIGEMLNKGLEHPTGFEVSTALALMYFHEQKVDIAVMEVGLGGAIDSTNVIIPLVSVITNVTMDHMEYLGNTIREIASVKAGIIKRGVPVVTAAEEPDALEEISGRALAQESDLYQVGRDLYYNVLELDERGTRFRVKDSEGWSLELFTPLVGAHQAINGTTVALIIRLLNGQGFKISDEVLQQGLRRSFWPARLEMVRKKPQVLLDAAHNLDGAIRLKRSLNVIYRYDRLIYVIGMLADKQRVKVMAQLGPLADIIVVTRPNSPRAGDWRAMTLEAAKYTPHVYEEEDIQVAVEKALSLAGPEDLICIAGSIYMVAYAREYFLKDSK